MYNRFSNSILTTLYLFKFSSTFIDHKKVFFILKAFVLPTQQQLSLYVKPMIIELNQFQYSGQRSDSGWYLGRARRSLENPRYGSEFGNIYWKPNKLSEDKKIVRDFSFLSKISWLLLEFRSRQKNLWRLMRTGKTRC